MSNMIEKFSTIIPDFKEVVEIFNGMLEQHTEDTAHVHDETKTSLVVLLGVLYKYQKRNKRRELEDNSSSLEDLSQGACCNITLLS